MATYKSSRSFHSDGEGYAGRIDVVAGPTGRRRWPGACEASIVLETYRDSACRLPTSLASTRISAPQLHAWRRAARDGLLSMPDDEALEFLPVSVSGGPEGPVDNRPTPLTLEIGDIRILVPSTFDARHLSRVIAAVRGGLMILPGGPYQIYLATRPVDFRKQHAGLSLIVQEVLGRDPFSGAVFIFRSKRGDQLKCLVWDQTGLVLVYKVLQRGRFPWPNTASGSARLTSAQLAMLWEGIDWRRPDWGAPPARVG